MPDRACALRGACAMFAVALFLPSVAHAQLSACQLPAILPLPKLSQASPSEPRRLMPIRSYTLALSWSPQYCAGRSGVGSFQCGTQGSNRFGFVLHGLWPNGAGKSWPQFCRPTQRLTPALLRANLCATPSVDLLQHEWAKHGTCMSRTPAAYFAQAKGLYGRLRFPDMASLMRDEALTADEFKRAFVTANAGAKPALPEQSVRVRLTREGWLDEVQICFDQRMKYISCPTQSRDVAPDQPMRIRPTV